MDEAGLQRYALELGLGYGEHVAGQVEPGALEAGRLKLDEVSSGAAADIEEGAAGRQDALEEADVEVEQGRALVMAVVGERYWRGVDIAAYRIISRLRNPFPHK